MRITFVIASADLAGGCKVVAIYARMLQDRGHQVLVVAPKPRTPALRDHARQIVNGKLPELIQDPIVTHLELQNAPHRYLDRNRPVEVDDVPDADVIVATWWETAHWLSEFPRSKGAKAYFIQHHEIYMTGQDPAQVNASWRLPFHKITISKWLVDLARELDGDEDVSLIYNSVDTEQFHAPERERNAVPTIGVMYATAPFKGLDISLPAIEAVRQRLGRVDVIAFGVHEPSPSLPLPDGTLYTRRPAQDKLRDLYSRCDLWLCGSRAEGFHLPPLEAMACRTPVVSTRVGGPMDIVRDGANGWLVDVGDGAGLADRMIEVLQRPPADWKNMSDAAYRTAVDYTWTDATELFEKALVRTIEKSEQAARRPAPKLGAASQADVEAAASRLAMVAGNFGDGPMLRTVVEDWIRFIGTRPAHIVMVDNGADRDTQRTLLDLANTGFMDRVGLVSPHTYDLGAHQCYVAEHLAGALGGRDYLLWYHVDTLPFRSGHEGWLPEALELLELDDVFSVGGSFNTRSKHHDAWPGWYFSDKCSENFALMKRSSFADAVREQAADFVASGYHGPHPASEPAERARYLIEVAMEHYIRRHRRYTLCRSETLDWSVFHTNVHGELLRAARESYLRREGVTEFLDAGNALQRGDEHLHARNYGKPSPDGPLKRLRIRFGESPIGPIYRRVLRGSSEIQNEPAPAEPLVADLKQSRSPGGPHDQLSVVLHLGNDAREVDAAIETIAVAFPEGPRQVVAYVRPNVASTEAAWKAYCDRKIDKLIVIRDLAAVPIKAAWWSENAVLAAAIEPYLLYMPCGSPHDPSALARALSDVAGGARAVHLAGGASILRRSALVEWLNGLAGAWALSGVRTNDRMLDASHGEISGGA